MQLRYVLYASHLHQVMGLIELRNLLSQSQSNNARDNLSGFLHIEDQIVLQYLEGPPEKLGATLARIREDNQHNQFRILAEGSLERRYFDGWKMALVESAAVSLTDLLGSECQLVRDFADTNPNDLISFLSANASLLRERPRVHS